MQDHLIVMVGMVLPIPTSKLIFLVISHDEYRSLAQPVVRPIAQTPYFLVTPPPLLIKYVPASYFSSYPQLISDLESLHVNFESICVEGWSSLLLTWEHYLIIVGYSGGPFDNI